MSRVERDDEATTTLWIGVLVFRWASLLWMLVLALTATESFVRPALAWFAIGAAFVWTSWVTTSRGREGPVALWVDLALSLGILLASAFVVPRGAVETRQLFATAYPISAVVAWGAARGPWGGLAAGVALGLAHGLTRPLNGIPLGELTSEQVQVIASGAVNYLLAGGAVGVVARLLERSSARVRAATEEALEARERAARLAERDAMGRVIHDSVLQSLSLLHKRAREVAASNAVSATDVSELAGIAAREERELRALILREPEEPHVGQVALRERLERLGREIAGLSVAVSAVGPLWVSATVADEIAAAVRQALMNVAEHAGVANATVYAEQQDESIAVSVRDDGRGFEYDEDALRRSGKAGVLKSMKGRIEALGGALRVESRPGEGTEVEFRIPVDRARAAS